MAKKKEEPKAFSIEIKGAGTKEEIMNALHFLIHDIKMASMTELENGVNWEGKDLTTTTSSFEDYTGYPYEEETQK